MLPNIKPHSTFFLVTSHFLSIKTSNILLLCPQLWSYSPSWPLTTPAMVNLFTVHLKMVPIAQTTLHQMEGFMNDELERMCKEGVMAYFKVLCQNLPGGTEENHKNTVKKDGVPAKIQDTS
jgi:hypothetical protein